MGTISMSGTELDRFELMRRLDRKELRQTDVAGLIGLSVRQVQRLLARFRRHGAAGLVSKKRGRPSNRRLPDTLRTQAMDLVRAHYQAILRLGQTTCTIYLAVGTSVIVQHNLATPDFNALQTSVLTTAQWMPIAMTVSRAAWQGFALPPKPSATGMWDRMRQPLIPTAQT